MAQPAQTLEGWYALHEVREVDRRAWNTMSEAEKNEVVEATGAFLTDAEDVKDAPEGSSAVYAVLGHKGDLMLLHLRPTVEDLLNLEAGLARTGIDAFTRRRYSFFSVTELGQYTADEAKGDDDPKRRAFIERRLKPVIPNVRYISFYPMNKRRGEKNNWYTLELEERRNLMYGHGMIGREYRGKVQQMISGSMGFDDWEWGVTLYATDPLFLKKIVQEMRFDEASALYAEFGPFYFGMRLRPDGLMSYLEGKPALAETGGFAHG